MKSFFAFLLAACCLLINATLPTMAHAAGPTLHRVQAQNKQADGWHLARSTDGRYSVKVPRPFNDFTVVDGKDILFIVGSTDEFGSKFAAMLAKPGTNATMFKRFKDDMKASGSLVQTFKGYQSVRTQQTATGSDGTGVITSLRFETPEGLVMLMVISPQAAANQTRPSIDRFFNSFELHAAP